jgi:hypothetical protein
MQRQSPLSPLTRLIEASIDQATSPRRGEVITSLAHPC